MPHPLGANVLTVNLKAWHGKCNKDLNVICVGMVESDFTNDLDHLVCTKCFVISYSVNVMLNNFDEWQIYFWCPFTNFKEWFITAILLSSDE